MKIALLFLTRKELNHPRVWQKMLEEANGLFSLYIHSKEPMEDVYFEKYRISTTVPTSYLIHNRAWQVLLQEALKEESNVKFIYLSESCMPLYPLKVLYHYLINQPESYMRYGTPRWPREDEREVNEIPIEHRYTNAEWIILNRQKASLITEDQTIIELCAKHIHDQESYPSSFFSLKGCLQEVFYRQTTYASFIKPTGPYPYHFQDYTPVEANYINNAKRGGCLFARKFTPEFPSEMLFSIANQRLMPAISKKMTEQLEQKITFLQAKEELSQANNCVLLPKLLLQEFFEIGYEIGVGLGLHMQRLCEASFLKKICGVDEYKRQVYNGISFNSEEEEEIYEYAQCQIQNLNVDATILRDSSLEIAKTIPDQTIDFIYFNEEHMSHSIEDQLVAWFPKLREGGIIAGYQVLTFYPDLTPSIHQFFSDKKLEVFQNILESRFWWVKVSNK
jgi:hypothetical protein